MAAKKIAGTAYLKADGVQYALGGTLTVSPGTVNREGVAGLSGPVGFKESPRIPWIEAECLVTDDTDVLATLSLTNATVQADLANGDTYVLRNAWLAGEPEIAAAEGTVTFRFEGLDCRKV